MKFRQGECEERDTQRVFFRAEGVLFFGIVSFWNGGREGGGEGRERERERGGGGGGGGDIF